MNFIRPSSEQARDAESAGDPPWLRKALAPHLPGWRGPVSVRRHEPDSPESLYLAEQAAIRAGTTLKDSRLLAERLAEAAAQGLQTEEECE